MMQDKTNHARNVLEEMAVEKIGSKKKKRMLKEPSDYKTSLTLSERMREGRLNASILHPSAVLSTAGQGFSVFLEVIYKRSLASPKNRPTLVSVLCSVIVQEQPMGRRTLVQTVMNFRGQ